MVVSVSLRLRFCFSLEKRLMSVGQQMSHSIDKIIELERRDQREISIRPHPHEFYLYFDV